MTTIFICIDWFHPAYKAGGPVQSIANLVAQYHQPDISFKIFCSNNDLDGSVISGVRYDEWVSHNTYTQVWYASKNRQSIKIIKEAIKSAEADILFINGIYSWYFNFVPLVFCKAPRKIIAARGMLHKGALGQKPLKKKLYLWCWKILGLHRKNQFHASDEAEKGFIQQTFGKETQVFVASNFPRRFSYQADTSKTTGTLRLVSVALISAMKNYLLVLQALATCTENIRYDIYGPVKDSNYWEQCLNQISLLPPNITVQYHGDLEPHKIESILQSSQVFILPSKSENFGHAIYEALSAGKPVITSNGTPWNDLYNKKAGVNVAIEKDGELASAIRLFAAMPQWEFSEWNKGARDYALNAIDIYSIIKQYDQMFAPEKKVIDSQ